MAGFLAPTKPRRAEKHHRVLDLFSPEARQRLHVLGHNPDQPSVGAIEEFGVFISQLSCLQRWRRAVACSLFPDPCSLFFFAHGLFIPVMERILKCNPQIQNSQARDNSAHRPVGRKGAEGGQLRK